MNRHKRSCPEHVRYRAGCDGCMKADRRYRKSRRQGTVLSAPVALSADRIHQLRANGYSLPILAAESGLGRSNIERISNGRIDWVQLKTFHRIETAYHRLRDHPGPDERARQSALRRGWTPPPPLPMPEPVDEYEVDDVAVERAVAGEHVPLTRAETLAAWVILEGRGMTANKIAERLHTTQKTVERWRSGAHRPASSRAHKRTA